MGWMRSAAMWGVAVMACALLSACGGGDGGGASGGGSGGGGSGGGGSSGSLTLSTASMAFTTIPPAATAAAQVVTATVSGVTAGSTLYLRIDITGSANLDVRNIQVTGANSGQATIQPRPQLPGTYTSTILVTACTTSTACTSGIIGTPQTINVTNTVGGIATGFASSSFVITSASPTGDYAAPVQLYSAGPWTATSSLPAVTVSPTSGTGGTSGIPTAVTLQLSQAAVAQMDVPSGHSTATVTFTSGGTQLSMPVSIFVQMPQIAYAGPRVVPAGSAGVVYLRGQQLGSVSIGQIRFGATPATSFAGDVTADKVIHAAQPALTAGTYPVTFTDTTGVVIPRSTASIVVVDPLGAPAQMLAYPDARARSVTNLHFDAERGALVLAVRYPAAGEAATEILRYIWSGTWSAAAVRALPFLSSLAPRMDGKGWMATALVDGGASNAIVLCTPDLAACTNALTASSAAERWTQIGMTIDGQPKVVTLATAGSAAGSSNVLAYSLADNSMQQPSNEVFHDGLVSVSGNGYRMLFGSGGTGGPLLRAIADDSSIGASGFFAQVDHMAQDRDGDRLLLNSRRVVDPLTFTEQASLPPSTLAGVLNREGTRAYTYDADGRIHSFDLSTALFTGQYPEIGAPIVPAGDPGAGAGGQDMQITLSPDGRTLFMAGSLGLVVQPLP